MIYQEVCPCCGHRERVYFHKLNKPMVNALKILCDMYLSHKRRLKLHELGLNNNDFNNFQKLQYWGLVHRDADGYVPTRKAYDFLTNRTWVYDVEGTWKGNVIAIDHPAWKNKKTPRKLITISNYGVILDYRYLKLEDYINY